MLQIALSDGDMEYGVRSDGNYILWQNKKKQFVSCLLLQKEEVVGKFSVGAQVKIETLMKTEEDLETASGVVINFHSPSFSFRA